MLTVFNIPSSPSSLLDVGEGTDVDEIIDKHYCSAIYRKLEECLATNERKWSKCQVLVKSLQSCNNQESTKERREEGNGRVQLPEAVKGK